MALDYKLRTVLFENANLALSDTAATAHTQPLLVLTVRHHDCHAPLNPALTAPSARTTRVTTPANACLVNDAFFFKDHNNVKLDSHI